MSTSSLAGAASSMGRGSATRGRRRGRGGRQQRDGAAIRSPPPSSSGKQRRKAAPAAAADSAAGAGGGEVSGPSSLAPVLPDMYIDREETVFALLCLVFPDLDERVQAVLRLATRVFTSVTTATTHSSYASSSSSSSSSSSLTTLASVASSSAPTTLLRHQSRTAVGPYGGGVGSVASPPPSAILPFLASDRLPPQQAGLPGLAEQTDESYHSDHQHYGPGYDNNPDDDDDGSGDGSPSELDNSGSGMVDDSDTEGGQTVGPAYAEEGEANGHDGILSLVDAAGDHGHDATHDYDQGIYRSPHGHEDEKVGHEYEALTGNSSNGLSRQTKLKDSSPIKPKKQESAKNRSEKSSVKVESSVPPPTRTSARQAAVKEAQKRKTDTSLQDDEYLYEARKLKRRRSAPSKVQSSTQRTEEPLDEAVVVDESTLALLREMRASTAIDTPGPIDPPRLHESLMDGQQYENLSEQMKGGFTSWVRNEKKNSTSVWTQKRLWKYLGQYPQMSMCAVSLRRFDRSATARLVRDAIEADPEEKAFWSSPLTSAQRALLGEGSD